MKITSKANLAEEKIDIISKMLFPPQCIPDTSSNKKNLETEIQRAAQEERRTRTQNLHEENERDRWAYVTDLYIERIKQQIDKIPALHQTLTNDEDEVRSKGEIELHPREIYSNISSPILIWPEDLIKFLQRAPATVRTDAIKKSNDGQAAGSILRYLYHLTFLKREPSLTQGRELFIEYHNFKYGLGRPRKHEARLRNTYTDTILQEIWKEFSSVAHYWAAFLVLHDDNIIIDNNALLNIELPKFLGIAEHFAEFGAFCTNKHVPGWNLLSVGHLVLNGIQSPRSKPKIKIKLINAVIEDEIIKLLPKKNNPS
jgi:hypothetical protein